MSSTQDFVDPLLADEKRVKEHLESLRAEAERIKQARKDRETERMLMGVPQEMCYRLYQIFRSNVHHDTGSQEHYRSFDVADKSRPDYGKESDYGPYSSVVAVSVAHAEALRLANPGSLLYR